MLFPFNFLGSSKTFDPDYLAFYNRVIAAGGSLTSTEQTATNQLVLDLKANSLWTPMIAIYPMVGASAASCAQNLKSSSFTGVFSSGWTFASTGITPNGTSAFMNTNVVGGTNLLNNNVGMGIYSRSQTTSTGGFGTGGALHIFPRFTDNNTYYRLLNIATGGINNGSSLGFIHGYANASGGNGFFNGSKVITNVVNFTIDISNLFFGGQRPSASNYDNHQIALCFASSFLTDTQALTFYTKVQAFQTSLSRQV